MASSVPTHRPAWLYTVYLSSALHRIHSYALLKFIKVLHVDKEKQLKNITDGGKNASRVNSP